MSRDTEIPDPGPVKLIRRRRCVLESCNELFRPKKANQRFCKPEHKAEWHFKTPHFRKLEPAIRSLVREMIRDAVKPGALK